MRIAHRDEVSNRRLREAFLREQRAGHIDASLVAIRLGWLHPKGQPDTSRVYRTLGLKQEIAAGKRYFRRNISRQRAAEICEAMGLDPVDIANDPDLRHLAGVL